MIFFNKFTTLVLPGQKKSHIDNLRIVYLMTIYIVYKKLITKVFLAITIDYTDLFGNLDSQYG